MRAHVVATVAVVMGANSEGRQVRMEGGANDLFDIRPMAGHIGAEVHGIDVLALRR